MRENLTYGIDGGPQDKVTEARGLPYHQDYRDDDQAIYAGWPVLEQHDPKAAEKLDRHARGQLGALYREGKITLHPAGEGKTADFREVLDKYFRGDATEEEIKAVIRQTSVAIGELYAVGLPEWRRWMDTYQADWALGPEVPYGRPVAIIQEPEPWQLDEKGHYQPRESWDYLLHFYRFLDQDNTQASLSAGNFSIRLMLKAVLARAATLRVFTAALGIEPFLEDLDSYLNAITRQIETYNREIERNQNLGGKILPQGLDLATLNLEDLKPASEALDDLREGLLSQVGEGWWEETLRHLEDAPKAARQALSQPA